MNLTEEPFFPTQRRLVCRAQRRRLPACKPKLCPTGVNSRLSRCVMMSGSNCGNLKWCDGLPACKPKLAQLVQFESVPANRVSAKISGLNMCVSYALRTIKTALECEPSHVLNSFFHLV